MILADRLSRDYREKEYEKKKKKKKKKISD